MRPVLRAIALVVVSVGCSCAAYGDQPESAVGPLMKLFQSGRLPAERQATVVEMICNRGNEHDLKVVFDKVVLPDGFAPDLRLKAMQWMTDAAVTRKVKPAGELAALEKLVVGEVAAANPNQQQAAIKLASTWKDAAISPALQALATDAKTKPELRRVAIEGLVAIGDAASQTTLTALLAKGNPLPVRMQAAAGLSGMDLPEACRGAAAVLADATPQDNPDEMLGAFLDRKNGAEQLAAEIAKQKLVPDVAKRSLRYMYSVGRSDAALSDVLSKAAGIAADAPPPTPEEVAKIAADVISKGDPARGEMIFRRKDLNCMKCHSLNRAGGQVGPELSAVGGTSPVDYVLNSILNPNLAVKEQYVTRIFVLDNGKVLTGVVIDRDDVRINMRDANGAVVKIPTADIDEEIEGKSLMPQGLTKFLTRAELLDLARFISELGKPGAYAVQQSKTIQRWRVLRHPPVELTADVPHLEHIRQFVLGSQPGDWDSAYGKVSGYLPLAELRGDKPTVLILQGEINASASGKVAVIVDSTESVQAWFDSNVIDAKKNSEVELTPGRHQITLRVEVSLRDQPQLRVEFKTPPDSSANYEVIGGP
ncbi:MAG: HEAT repeat domain-containing protein [Planctomycetes bacterium]|nr:HEAT repeat domain-containing protein [Planctomycetota bacterium]